MDIVFTCPECQQELAVEASGAGSEIECPSCGRPLVVPEPNSGNVRDASAEAGGAVEDGHFVVPQHHDQRVERLIEKPLPPLDALKNGDKKLRIKTIRHTDCVEVGKDLFDEKVTQFVNDIGEKNIVSIETIAYSHLDMGSKACFTDYGVLILYKG